MDANWASIYNTSDRIHAEVLKSMLEANEVPVILLNKQDSAYLSFGMIEIFVHREDIVKAKFLLSDNE